VADENDMRTPEKVFWLVLGIGAVLVGLWALATAFVRSVARCIETWKPPESAASEAQLRDSLAEHVRRCLPRASVAVEYGAGNSKVDIVVSSGRGTDAERVAIEVKLGLRRKAELDRLVGQVMGYKALGFGKAMVVSVKPDLALHEALKTREVVPGLSGYMMVLRK